MQINPHQHGGACPRMPCLACEHRRCEHDRTTISWAALAWRTASGMLTLSAPHTRYSITVRAYIVPIASPRPAGVGLLGFGI